ncbi:protein PIMREG [Gracilinanus agilis]|uniref:protein PIMREG n=1 Tax=Gracilinanus agilis TaxID=191870 RepID=UPI001CFE513C|nr:protein PIMREG [Gracilinanus agilis]
MSSVWPGLPGARGRGSHQMLTEEESGSPRPRKPLASSLDTLCARLSRRLPLAALDANFQDGPSWEPLGSPESARGPLGSAAQRFRRSRQAAAAPTESPPPRRRRGRSAQLAGATPAASQGSGLRRLSRWLARDPLQPLRRRSQREAALRSPYASPAPLCSPRGGGCREQEDEEEEEEEGPEAASVASGIRQLEHLSQAFDEAISMEERKHARTQYRGLMIRNLRAARQAERLPWASGWRRARRLGGP